MLEGAAEAKDMAFACTLCGRCGEVCPYNLDISSMLLEIRSRINTSDDPRDRKSSVVEKGFVKGWFQLMLNSRLLGAVRTLGRWFELPFARKGKVGKLPIPVLAQWTRKRDLPVFPAKTFRQLWKSGIPRKDEEDK
jgi:L-lactate dehydrogenase complex protein LldF